ncbi:2882_t:CDS:2, partial [Racocetra persica]
SEEEADDSNEDSDEEYEEEELEDRIYGLSEIKNIETLYHLPSSDRSDPSILDFSDHNPCPLPTSAFVSEASTRSDDLSSTSTSLSTFLQIKNYKRREIYVPLPNLSNLPPLVEVDDFDSDANDVIDEARRLSKLKKENNKPLDVIRLYNIAGNAYLQEDSIKPDPRGYITYV